MENLALKNNTTVKTVFKLFFGLVGVIGIVNLIFTIIYSNDYFIIGQDIPIYFFAFIFDVTLPVLLICYFIMGFHYLSKNNFFKLVGTLFSVFAAYFMFDFLVLIFTMIALNQYAALHRAILTYNGSVYILLILFVFGLIVSLIGSISAGKKKETFPIKWVLVTTGAILIVTFIFTAITGGLTSEAIISFILIILLGCFACGLPFLLEFFGFKFTLKENENVVTESTFSTPINVEPTKQPSMSVTDELRELKKLFDEGVLSEEEYKIAKEKVISKL